MTDLALGLADRSLATKVYEELRERIIEGVLQPGERIRERELADELNVSRIPIREALPRLESEGYVKSTPRRGVVVTNMTLSDVEELFTVRLSLEVLAARLAAQRCAGGADPTQLTEKQTVVEREFATGLDAEIAAANSALHEEILGLTENRLLISLMAPVNGRVRRLFRLEADRDQSVLCAEHRALVDAIVGGNVELAGSLAYAHVEHSRAESLRLMRERLEA